MERSARWLARATEWSSVESPAKKEVHRVLALAADALVQHRMRSSWKGGRGTRRMTKTRPFPGLQFPRHDSGLNRLDRSGSIESL